MHLRCCKKHDIHLLTLICAACHPRGGLKENIQHTAQKMIGTRIMWINELQSLITHRARRLLVFDIGAGFLSTNEWWSSVLVNEWRRYYCNVFSIKHGFVGSLTERVCRSPNGMEGLFQHYCEVLFYTHQPVKRQNMSLNHFFAVHDAVLTPSK